MAIPGVITKKKSPTFDLFYAYKKPGVIVKKAVGKELAAWRNLRGVTPFLQNPKENLINLLGAAIAVKAKAATPQQAYNVYKAQMGVRTGKNIYLTEYQTARENTFTAIELQTTQQQLATTGALFEEYKTKYETLLKNPPAGGFDWSIFGDLKKYVPYIIIGASALIALMVLPGLIRKK